MMTALPSYPEGKFCWVELATTDTASAKAFYTSLFGWTAADTPGRGDAICTVLRQDGNDVAALYAMSVEMRQRDMRPHWRSYISVENVDAAAQKASALGAAVLIPPFDVLDAGRMALVQDPTGAAFALWEPRAHVGAGLVNEPVSMCWNELQTRDVGAALEFYGAMFGWTSRVGRGAAAHEYHTLLDADRMAGGMVRIEPHWRDVQSGWVVYFAVRDCRATLEQARAAGGSIALPPTELEGRGSFAFVRDPQGALFAVSAMSRDVAD